jgi:hypothetical protein
MEYGELPNEPCVFKSKRDAHRLAFCPGESVQQFELVPVVGKRKVKS